MIELETKLSMSADQVREFQAKLQKETPVRTYPMETPKKESAGEPEDDVDMDDEVIKYSGGAQGVAGHRLEGYLPGAQTEDQRK